MKDTLCRSSARAGVLALLGAASLLFSGCGGGSQNDASSETAGSSDQSASAPSVVLPEEQARFKEVVASFAKRYEAASNELKKSALRSERKSALAATLQTMEFTGWVGKIETMETTGEGNAHVAIQLHGIPGTIQNNNNEVSAALGDKTLIRRGSDLYKAVASLNEGQRVRVSGVFQKGQKDHIEEISLTEEGAMTEPDFAVKFSTIEKY